MGTIDGTLVVHEGETGVEVYIDWADRRAVSEGQTIVSATIEVLDSDGDTSTHLTVSNIGISETKVTFEVDVSTSAIRGVEYELRNWVTLSGGQRISECLTVIVEPC